MNPENFLTSRIQINLPYLRVAEHIRNDVQFAIALSLLFCGFMIINVQITTKFSLLLI